MRGPLIALLAVFAPTAGAAEPLYLRIRPAFETVDGAERRQSASEAVWARAERRAKLAIASVCTGCLRPDRAISNPPAAAIAPPVEPRPAAEIAPPNTPFSQTASR